MSLLLFNIVPIQLQTTTFYGPLNFVRDYTDEPVPER